MIVGTLVIVGTPAAAVTRGGGETLAIGVIDALSAVMTAIDEMIGIGVTEEIGESTNAIDAMTAVWIATAMIKADATSVAPILLKTIAGGGTTQIGRDCN